MSSSENSTEAKVTTDASSANDELTRRILASISDCVKILDLDGNLLQMNELGRELLGIPDLKPFLGSCWLEFWNGADREAAMAAVQKAKGGNAGHFEGFFKTLDGIPKWWDVVVTPILGVDGKPEKLLSISRDITVRKHAEDVIETVMSSITDFAYNFDREGRFVYANKALLDLWGLNLKDVVGRNFFDLKYPEELAAKLHRQIQQVIETREPLSDETPYTSPTGGGGFYEYIFSPVIAADGSVQRVVGSTRDITERVRADEHVRQANAEKDRLLESERAARTEAERASRMKDEFLATLSHELRTPLNAILGWSQIMKSDNADPDDVAQGLEVIERNARVQSQIIEDLLDMSRIISGKVRLDVQPLDLCAIVQAAVETARPTAAAKGVRLQSVIDPLLGVTLSGDAGRLQQVLWNLLSNAIKFTPRDGRVQVMLERVDSHLEISVIDSGEGIKPEFLPFVFDRFRQADASTSRRHGGLGLGLSIVKQLVELHGGSAHVKSAGVGQGTTFVVILPLTVVHPEPEPQTERRHPHAASRLSGMADICVEIAGVRVLVVDDEPDARALIKRLLEDCHADVTIASTAEEAVNLVRNGKFQVLVSDVGMPGEDGYSLIKRVRSLGKHQGGDIPAIALTAYARAEDRVRAISAGFMMHVSKPVEPVELVTMVAGAAGRTGRAF